MVQLTPTVLYVDYHRANNLCLVFNSDLVVNRKWCSQNPAWQFLCCIKLVLISLCLTYRLWDGIGCVECTLRSTHLLRHYTILTMLFCHHRLMLQVSLFSSLTVFKDWWEWKWAVTCSDSRRLNLVSLVSRMVWLLFFSPYSIVRVFFFNWISLSINLQEI